MSESPSKSRIKINLKNSRRFVGVLRQLAKSDTSLINKMKVTVYKDDIIEEKKQFFIAPLMFLSSQNHLNNHDSTENTNLNTNLDSNIDEIQISQNAEFMDYPDSSDFDEE